MCYVFLGQVLYKCSNACHSKCNFTSRPGRGKNRAVRNVFVMYDVSRALCWRFGMRKGGCFTLPIILCKYAYWTQWALYISGVRSSGHRVKPNMAALEVQSYVGFSPPARSFMFTCYAKTAQEDWNRRNSGPPCPLYLASLGDLKFSLQIYRERELTAFDNLTCVDYHALYAITWLLCAFSLVVDRDLLVDTHADGVKSTSDHVSGFFVLYTLWRHLWSITVNNRIIRYTMRALSRDRGPIWQKQLPL